VDNASEPTLHNLRIPTDEDRLANEILLVLISRQRRAVVQYLVAGRRSRVPDVRGDGICRVILLV
jgi:Spy/CpxP family protein refolding chaperone